MKKKVHWDLMIVMFFLWVVWVVPLFFADDKIPAIMYLFGGVWMVAVTMPILYDGFVEGDEE